ncbi:hypothetical protein EDD15DRAFT_2203629 [Pisolithus albus]|nr:hypothetical protein EDD15DRAFT_2203629 [Pisolithus albus]
MFCQSKGSPEKGDLALFCTACPQLGINVDLRESFHDWKYTCTIVMDGNFKAEHMKDRCPEDQVWLMDGHRYLVTHPAYQAYLKATPHITESMHCVTAYFTLRTTYAVPTYAHVTSPAPATFRSLSCSTYDNLVIHGVERRVDHPVYMFLPQSPWPPGTAISMKPRLRQKNNASVLLESVKPLPTQLGPLVLGAVQPLSRLWQKGASKQSRMSVTEWDVASVLGFSMG